MNTLSYRTEYANNHSVKKDWIVVDAENQVLGRLCSQIAKVLRGKNKTNFTPNVDCGDNVIVINCEKVKLTGKKMDDKVYIRYTGHPGGQRFNTPRSYMATQPHKVIELAVKNMLPKNSLGRKIFGNLHVYAGTEHPHVAQNPKVLTF
ncbi:MAG TPA: 50S ribosomal protein L13 [Cytophagales bacterium]|nr:50S ribosomal protein L13 [Cytophagales bacterium]